MPKIYVPDSTNVTGSLLLDNFSTRNIKKTDTWILNSVDEEIRDEYGAVISNTTSRWDSLSQELIPYYKHKNDIIYNENGQIIQNQSSYWQEFDENWTNEMKQLNEYDDSGNLTKSESYNWDLSISNWAGNLRSEADRDEFGNVILSVTYRWDYESQNWLPYNKVENSYNSTGMQLMGSYYDWNTESKIWIGNYKSETILNDNQEAIKTINYEWDFSENDWRVSYFYMHTLDNTVYNEEGLPVLIIYTTWNEDLNVWSPTEKYYVYYSSHSISTNIKSLETFVNEIVEVYPNPASELIYIRLKNEVSSGSYSLFNTLGQLQKNATITNKITTLQVNNLPNGIYFLIIDTNNIKISKKIILR